MIFIPFNLTFLLMAILDLYLLAVCLPNGLGLLDAAVYGIVFQPAGHAHHHAGPHRRQ